MKIEIVAAIANGSVIGKNNQLPWQLAADLKRFRDLTSGHSVIMGRRTWEGLPGPLRQRQNIVVSKTMTQDHLPDGVVLVGSFYDAVHKSFLPSPAFAIGGTEIYREALPYANRMHITQINYDFGGDVYFPYFSKLEWKETNRVCFEATDDRLFSYDFVEYVRR